MQMDCGLRLEISQRLTMTPQLCQAIAILQLSSLQLAEKVEEALLENPVLEVEDKKEAEIEVQGAEAEQAAANVVEKYFKWADYCNDHDDARRKAPDTDYLSPVSFAVAGPVSLHEHLELQLHLSTVNDRARKVGEYFIGCIDDNGYLHCTPAEAAAAAGVRESCAIEVLKLLQTFDPAGIGAHDLRECLLLQIERQGSDNPLLVAIIDRCLDDVAAGRIRLIAEQLACTPHDVQEAIDMIRMLTPKPGQVFGGDRNLGYVLPDVNIERVADEFVVIVNDSDVPRITVNPYYRSVIREADGEARKFVEGRINAAVWLIKSIEQRRMTLFNVTGTIVKMQDDFFRKGPRFLRPMTMKKVADHLEVHESTVSRTVANKYAATPFGLFPLRFFFSAGIMALDGECMAASRVKQELRDTIAAEDLGKPLSDQALMVLLAGRGMELSRRTVAKYREGLGIAASGKRKRY